MNQSKCKFCGKPIYWVRDIATKRSAPVNLDMTPHKHTARTGK